MTSYKTKREIADSLERYFSERLLGRVMEWQREAETNKEFFLGSKQFLYICTLQGHEPVVDYPKNENT